VRSREKGEIKSRRKESKKGVTNNSGFCQEAPEGRKERGREKGGGGGKFKEVRGRGEGRTQEERKSL